MYRFSMTLFYFIHHILNLVKLTIAYDDAVIGISRLIIKIIF